MTRSRTITMILGLFVSAVCLYFSFREMDWTAFVKELRIFDWRLFVFGLLLAVAHNLVSALRWWMLLRKSGKLSFADAFWSLRIAYFGNATLPGKIGEGIKIWLIKTRTNISAAHAIGAMAGDRLAELLSLMAFIYVSGAVLGFRKEFMFGKVILGLTVFVVLILLVLRFLPQGSEGRFQKVWDFLNRVKAGLKPLSQPSHFFNIFVISLLAWALHGAMVVLFSYGVDSTISFYKAILVTAAVSFAVSVPAAPGNYGPFELAAIYFLHDLLGLPIEKAASIAILYHLVQMLPTYAFGVIGVSLYGLKKKDLPNFKEAS